MSVKPKLIDRFWNGIRPSAGRTITGTIEFSDTPVRLGQQLVNRVQEQISDLRGLVQQRQQEQLRRQTLIYRLGNGDAENRSKVDEKHANRALAISFTSLGFAIVGTTVYPPLALLSLPWVILGSFPMLKAGWAAARQRQVTVDTLSSIVIVTCLFGQYYVAANFAGTIFYVSRKLLQKVKNDSRKQVIDVFRQQPKTAFVLVDGTEVEVPFEQVQIGDLVVVSAGGFVPVDGTIVQGTATIDQHILTGESQPAEKGTGDRVFASTVVMSGRICVEVEQAGQDTIVAQIGQILNETVEYKSSIQLRSEQLTNKTVLPTLIAGGLVLPFVGPYSAAAFLNSHYKYKMNIVAPVSILTFLNLMSQHHILIKDGRTLDYLNQVDTVVFDKTGTLTNEQPTVEKVHVFAGQDEDQVLGLAATAEHKQMHPIAQAILHEAKLRQLPLLNLDESAYKVGYGLSVWMEGQLVRVGSQRFMEMEGVSIPAAVEPLYHRCKLQAHSLVMVALGSELIGAIELRATVRPEAQRVIQELRKRKKIQAIYIISGDHEAPTRQLAEDLGIDHYFAETLPENKANLIDQLQAEGRFVCFVGDGINDSIALKKSQVSVSLRGASTVATDTAQIILMDGSLESLQHLFQLAEAYDQNSKVGFASLLVPMGIGMAGALFFQFGVNTTILLSYSGLLIGMLNSVLPLARYRKASEAPRGEPDVG